MDGVKRGGSPVPIRRRKDDKRNYGVMECKEGKIGEREMKDCYRGGFALGNESGAGGVEGA